jgi:hypothetical protein
MKSFQFKQVLPHLLAIGIFLLVSLILCKPALDSNLVMRQGDISGWQGMSHQSFQYKEQHGHFPLWTTNMFSGMPGFQIAMEGYWSPIGTIDHAFQLWLPQPFNFFFLACIGFYIFCLCFGIRLLPSIIGSIAFAYCSFSPIIVAAGHNTQMLALAYAPAVIGAYHLLFQRKYISGFVLTLLFTTLQIGQGHQQISYYLFLILGAQTIAYAVQAAKQKRIGDWAKGISLAVVAGIIGVAVSAITLLPTMDFTKYSKRGGQLVMDQKAAAADKVENGKTTGLSKDYAFMWSYGIGETFSLMFPGVKGYGLHIAQRDDEQEIFPKLTEKSNLAKFFSDKLNTPEDQAASYAMQQSGSLYWGDQPFTSGPVYIGAIICFLAILGMFLLNNEHKWWLLIMSVLGILFAWGEHFAAFNYFIFDHFPLYNKFRVPTMALVIPQLLLPMLAAFTLNKLADGTSPADWKKFKNGLYVTAALFLCIGYYYTSSDFSHENKERTAAFKQLMGAASGDMQEKYGKLNQQYPASSDNRFYENMYMSLQGAPEPDKLAREALTALRKDRADFLLADILRSLVFVLIAAAAIALYLKQKLNATVMLVATGLAATIELVSFDLHYLSDKNFDTKDKYEASEFPMSNADRMILADPDPNYRVFNTASLEESKTSYYHKSIGGYHPAKLGIYDDLIQYQLSGRPNMSVVNMLNAKYIIQNNGKEPVAMRNPGALGNAWFVNAVHWVNGPVEEMKALDNLNPLDTAVIDQSFKTSIPAFTPTDSTATIRQTQFNNDTIRYESNSTQAHLAVFSEIFYKDWNAYIDGQKTPYAKANYVLRAMVVPAGKHQIEFRFEPSVFFTGRSISFYSGWLVALLLLGWILYLLIPIGKKKQS